MRLYEFSPSVASRYVSAKSIVLPENIKYYTCELCGANEQVIWEEIQPCFVCETITSNRRLPDLMLYGGRIVNSFGSWFVVSKKFKDLFEAERFKGARFYSGKLTFKRRNNIYNIDEPYFVMYITGRADYDFKKMNVEVSKCRRCGIYHFDSPYFPLTPRNGIYPTLLDEKTWDGSDVFNNGDCTERFVRSVLGHGLTGFEFLPFDHKFDKFENKLYIKRLSDLLKR